MGDIYSKPGAPNPRPQLNTSSNSHQHIRSREPAPNGSQPHGADQLSSATLEALSRLQGGTSNRAADHMFNLNSHRPQRHQDAISPSMLTNELLAAAQLGGQLTPAQLNALVAAYQQQHHQQQQQQPQLNRLTASNFGPIPTTTPKSSPASTSSHGNRPGPSHLIHNPMASPGYNQKRPASGHSQFMSAHGSQSNAGRPPSVSQLVHPHQSPQRPPHLLPPNHHSGHLPTHHLSHLDSAASGHVSRRSPIPVSHPHHSTSIAVTSQSHSPAVGGYQVRRSQAIPPNSIPNKRPRLSGNPPPTSQQQGYIHGPVGSHESGIPAGVEALMSTLVANKALASLASSSGLLNPSPYNSVTEAAVVGLSPLFSAAVNSGTSLGSPGASGASVNNFPAHFSSLTQSQAGGPLLNQCSNVRGSFPNCPPQAHVPPPVPPPQVTSSQFKPQSSVLPPNVSRATTDHSGHPHLGGHAPPLSFLNQPHSMSHSATSQHHFLGHANLTHGSGVLRQQTKEPAYHPQVEAISPAPEESRLVDAHDAKLHRERDEIGRKLVAVEADLNKQLGHQRHLEERETRLTARLASATGPGQSLPGTAPSTLLDGQLSPKHSISSDAERSFENPIQAFISENRRRTWQHHLIFARLCGPHVKASPYALPLYRQPSDLPYICAIRAKFRDSFRPKLIKYLRRHRKAEEARIRFLAQQYSHHSTVFTKKMEKMLNNSKQRHRELRHREIFERILPEVKKNREDKEMSATDSATTKVAPSEDAESSNQSANGALPDGSQTPVYDPIEEMNKMKEYAIDPPIMLAPWQRRYRFIHQAGLITDCRAQLQEELDLSKWTEEERQIFRERYLATPKNFSSIASYLEGKTVGDCIHYYYLSKKKEGYKQLIKKHTARRRRAVQSDRSNTGGGGGNQPGSGGGNGPNTGSSNGGNGNVPSFFGPATSEVSPGPVTNTHSNNEPQNMSADADQSATNRRPHSSSISASTTRARGSRGRSGAAGRSNQTTNPDETINQPEHAVNTSSAPVTVVNDVEHRADPRKSSRKKSSTSDSISISDSSGSARLTSSERDASSHHQSPNTNSSTSIRDIIHLAIEKNLQQSCSRDLQSTDNSNASQDHGIENKIIRSSKSNDVLAFGDPNFSYRGAVQVTCSADMYAAAKLATENAKTEDLATAIYVAAATASAPATRVGCDSSSTECSPSVRMCVDQAPFAKSTLFKKRSMAQPIADGSAVRDETSPAVANTKSCNANLLSAEHAAWLALHAQAAAVAVEAGTRPSLSEPNCSFTHRTNILPSATPLQSDINPGQYDHALAISERTSHILATDQVPADSLRADHFRQLPRTQHLSAFSAAPSTSMTSIPTSRQRELFYSSQRAAALDRPRSSEPVETNPINKCFTFDRANYHSLSSSGASPERRPSVYPARKLSLPVETLRNDSCEAYAAMFERSKQTCLESVNDDAHHMLRTSTAASSGNFLDVLIHSQLNSQAGRDMNLDPSRVISNKPLHSNFGERTGWSVNMTRTGTSAENITLEQQINKAIAEEIQAQLRSVNANFQINFPTSTVELSHSSKTSDAPKVNRMSVVPLKKRDRFELGELTQRPFSSEANIVGSSRDFTVIRPNGTRFVGQDIDPRASGAKRTESETAEREPQHARSASTSPLDETESPGKLQIDLSASAPSPDTKRMFEFQKSPDKRPDPSNGVNTRATVPDHQANKPKSSEFTALRLWLPNDIRRATRSQDSSPMESSRSIVNRST